MRGRRVWIRFQSSKGPAQKETRAPFIESEWDLATMEPKSGIYPGKK